MRRRTFSTIVSALCACLAFPANAPAEFSLTADERAKLKAGEVVLRISESGGDADGFIQAAIDIPAPRTRVWPLMLDCERALVFMKNLRSCKVLKRDPNGAWDVREHRLQWISILPEIRSVFRSDYTPETSIRFSRVAGDLRRLEGNFQLEPLGGGDGTRLFYEARVGLSVWVPWPILYGAIEADIPRFLRDFRAEVMRSPAG